MKQPKTLPTRDKTEIDELDLEDEEVIVDVSRLEKAKNSAKIKRYLSHSKLQKIIRQIDSNRNRKKALLKQIDMDSDFRVFIDEMLLEMGYLDEHN